MNRSAAVGEAAFTSSADLLKEALVWDNHGRMPLRPDDETFLPQLSRYRSAGGGDVVFLNIGFSEQAIEEHIRMLAHFRRWLAERPDEYVLIRSVADIGRARATGRLAVGFDIEGTNPIADQTSLIGLYYDLGVRWMLMAYNRNNGSAAAAMTTIQDCPRSGARSSMRWRA